MGVPHPPLFIPHSNRPVHRPTPPVNVFDFQTWAITLYPDLAELPGPSVLAVGVRRCCGTPFHLFLPVPTILELVLVVPFPQLGFAGSNSCSSLNGWRSA